LFRSYKYTDYREFACPICRKKTAIPSGGVHKLPDNFLIAGLSEMISQKSSGSNGSVKVLSNCEICKTVHDREREATSRCLECQKFLCRHCVQAHQAIPITRDHSIYELEIEKDILCKVKHQKFSFFSNFRFSFFLKHHLTEFVRYYCEQCESCICIACTYVDHRDHDLADFRTAAAHHKAFINECLDGCKTRMGELEAYLHVIRRCDENIAQIESSIHSLASTYEKSLRIKEQELVQQISELYGEETNEFIKRREELDEYFEQIKNTCSLTELVIHGKDIELLLVKKQLMEKFRELDAVELDPLPENICMRLDFQPGELTLGTLKVCEMTPMDDDEREGEVDEEDGEVVLREEEDEEVVSREEEDEEAVSREEEAEEEEKEEEEEKPKANAEISNITLTSIKTFASIATQTEDLITTTTTHSVQVSKSDLSLKAFLFLRRLNRTFSNNLSIILYLIFRQLTNVFLPVILILKMVVFLNLHYLSNQMDLFRLHPSKHHHQRHRLSLPKIRQICMNKVTNYLVVFVVYLNQHAVLLFYPIPM
jgi:tripartite motif-containing protein 56